MGGGLLSWRSSTPAGMKSFVRKVALRRALFRRCVDFICVSEVISNLLGFSPCLKHTYVLSVRQKRRGTLFLNQSVHQSVHSSHGFLHAPDSFLERFLLGSQRTFTATSQGGPHLISDQIMRREIEKAGRIFQQRRRNALLLAPRCWYII